MILRDLEEEDAPLMLEWMHDESVVKDLKTDFASKTLEDCKNFIKNSRNDEVNRHYAIDVDGEYMGTVSLKNIEKDKAEFAITIRKSAMGKGISTIAMKEIIRIGFEEMNLRKIYWYVDPENKRAVKFYDKNGYQTAPEKIDPEKSGGVNKYIWYQVETC